MEVLSPDAPSSSLDRHVAVDVSTSASPLPLWRAREWAARLEAACNAQCITRVEDEEIRYVSYCDIVREMIRQ